MTKRSTNGVRKSDGFKRTALVIAATKLPNRQEYRGIKSFLVEYTLTAC
jgi:hypothetical protein